MRPPGRELPKTKRPRRSEPASTTSSCSASPEEWVHLRVTESSKWLHPSRSPSEPKAPCRNVDASDTGRNYSPQLAFEPVPGQMLFHGDAANATSGFKLHVRKYSNALNIERLFDARPPCTGLWTTRSDISPRSISKGALKGATRGIAVHRTVSAIHNAKQHIQVLRTMTSICLSSLEKTNNNRHISHGEIDSLLNQRETIS